MQKTEMKYNKNKKKRILLLFLTISSLFFLLFLSMSALGVSASVFFTKRPDIKELDPEQLRQIKQSYLDLKIGKGYPDHMTVDDVCVEEYCGSYNGCIVIMFIDSETIYTQAIRIVNIAGICMMYNDGNEIYAWKNGKIYTLEQAYAVGILSKFDIKKIRDIHNQY